MGTTRRQLTIHQKWNLTGGTDPEAFAGEDERRAAWEVHGAYLMRGAHDGHRPDGWCSYESPIPRPEHHVYERAALWEADLLNAQEREECERQWRGRFDQAHE